MIEVYPCGTLVKPIMLQVACMIIQVSIKFDAVSYQLSYFNDGKEENTWMTEKEFTADQTAVKNKIGYK